MASTWLKVEMVSSISIRSNHEHGAFDAFARTLLVTAHATPHLESDDQRRASCLRIIPSSIERMTLFSSGSNRETASN